MALTEDTHPAPVWLRLADIEQTLDGSAVVVLPELVADDDGKTVAFFRVEAQEIRVRAKEAGLTPVLLTPAGAEVAGYSEYARDWILPVLVGTVLTVPAQLAADLISARLTDVPQHQAVSLSVQYREALIEGGSVRIRALEGPAHEVERALRARVEAAEELPQLVRDPPGERR